MKLTKNGAAALATEPKLTGQDLRVWLLLVDNMATPTELAHMLGVASSGIGNSCRKLLTAGWIEVADQIGRSKRYTARGFRKETAELPGQAVLDI